MARPDPPVPGDAKETPRASQDPVVLHRSIFSGDGETAELMRSIDWSRNELGPVDGWPQSLRTALSILLESRFPMYIAWGPEFTQFYNDGYRPILGSTKHPLAMGGPARVTFSESWQIIGPMFHGVREGRAVGAENWMLPLDRHGYLEECYFTYSYSPIRDESGGVGGVLVTVSETTRQVLGERRLQTLRDLADRAGIAQREEDVWQEAAQTLQANAFDLPFALLYRAEKVGERPTLMASVGWGTGASEPARLAAEAFEWPFQEASAARGPRLVADLRHHLAELPGGKWPEPAPAALVLPIARPGTPQPYGFLVTGLSPRRALDQDYRGFLELIADRLSTAVTNARAFHDERKRAEALLQIDHAKTVFFSNVSHELRTPLTLMLSPIEDVLGDAVAPLSELQRERLELIRRNGLRLQKLVNSLLDFARIEAGRAQAAFAPTDLAALTRDLVSSFDSAMTSAGLRLQVDCPPLPDVVHVDPSMWEKIVLNLLSNALKFTFQGSIEVALKWRGDRVDLTVHDTGTGIPGDELPRVFERFYRVEGARGRSHEGTGIGLALVQELVALHSGAVSVESVLGEGTTFTVWIPTGSAHVPEEQLARAPTLQATEIDARAFLAEVSQWNGAEAATANICLPTAPLELSRAVAPSAARILVADDNADMRQYLSRLLSPHWSVEAVEDGHQALLAARANPPDLVLSDVMMPGMGGLALVQRLRESETTRWVPVLLLSARAGEEATIEGLESGADEYLIKPFSANELLARVKAQLTVSRLRQDAIRSAQHHAETSARLAADAERATRLREETLRIVSHDLRSPLTAIATAAELLVRSLGNEARDVPLRRYTETIRRGARSMNRLVDDLLDLASIDAGGFSLDPEPVAANDLIHDIRERFEAQALDGGVTLGADVATGLAALECDRERVFQVLSNLVSNALRFTPAGGSIQLGADSDGDGSAIRFRVADSGAGIPAEMLPHVFDRHWQAQRKNREGHGLGLSIARGIVESHGGHISVESTPHTGSVFSFSLPLQARRARPSVSAPPGARTSA
jgi:signal transduction histidine kinase